jgi:hypothetical protein
VLAGGTIETEYAADDNAFIHMCSPGEIIQVYVASGQTVVKGSGLTAQTTGKWAVDATNAAVIALEPTGGALAADKHVRCRVL